MRREQIDRKRLPEKRTILAILPLDARDPDIVRAKELVQKQTRPRGRAA